MPTCRRKRVMLIEPSEALLLAAKADPERDVYYLEETGEIFESYEAYAARMSFYRLKQFQCEVTGKSGLDYFEAVKSEQNEARTMHSRFSESLKPAILRAVQWQVMGRLDHLVEAVFERFKDRYFADERIVVDVSNVKYSARVQAVRAPQPGSELTANGSSSSIPPRVLTAADPRPHLIGGDLKTPTKDANERDDPTKYFYDVQLLELERERTNEKHRANGKSAENELIGTIMLVQCPIMSRDRLSFSKSILRRFIRDCVDRDPAVASPWTVKPAIAKRYGVDSIMPEETRKGVENIKKGEHDKRKKVWEDKDGPPSKRQKKLTAAQEEKVKALAASAERREQEARERAALGHSLDDTDRLAAEKKKKKPVRYPTEDLDVRLSDKEKKTGVRSQRPLPSRTAVPFNNEPGVFEQFLLCWNFLVIYGHPLHLSPFTLDEFEQAMRHSVMDPACAILAEVHSTLIYNLRTVPFIRHSAVMSLLRHKESDRHEDVLGVSIDQLSAAMADIGNNWERVPLRHSEVREGWEDALLGCLKDHASLENFPRLREILTRLLFAPETSEDPSAASTSSRSSSPTLSSALCIPSTPRERYHTLPPADRVAILAFMSNLAISSKAIHSHMETCEEQLTALRKEKIEVNRMKKSLLEEMSVLAGETKEKEAKEPKEESKDEQPPVTTLNDDDAAMQDMSDLSEIEQSEAGSESPVRPAKKGSRQQDKNRKSEKSAHAKEREQARAKAALIKQAQADHRKLDEEVNKLERRLEGIEREFRKLLGAVRLKPLGRDRFYNRIWWFDGNGSASLVGSGGTVQYGAGRIYVQGPSEFDADLLKRRYDEDINARRREEEGEEGIFGSGEWGVYQELEELEEFVAWLNPKGLREVALKNALTKWWPHIAPGIRKRIADSAVHAKLPDARRSMRTKTVEGRDISREPYMMWTNRRAVNAS